MFSSHVLGVPKVGKKVSAAYCPLHILIFLCLGSTSLGPVLGIPESLTHYSTYCLVSMENTQGLGFKSDI